MESIQPMMIGISFHHGFDPEKGSDDDDDNNDDDDKDDDNDNGVK